MHSMVRMMILSLTLNRILMDIFPITSAFWRTPRDLLGPKGKKTLVVDLFDKRSFYVGIPVPLLI